MSSLCWLLEAGAGSISAERARDTAAGAIQLATYCGLAVIAPVPLHEASRAVDYEVSSEKSAVLRGTVAGSGTSLGPPTRLELCYGAHGDARAIIAVRFGGYVAVDAVSVRVDGVILEIPEHGPNLWRRRGG